jgi:hypothetical protein
MRKSLCAFLTMLIVGTMLAGCNLPRQEPGAAQTAAALTVAAQLTPLVPPSPTASLTPAAFPTLPPANTLPANTLPPAATATANCDNAKFDADVTIPDDTVIDAGQNFTKTWRLRNIGNCSWTPSYALVFVSGAAMNGPAVQALTGNVNPGQSIDVSVVLTAPNVDGTYKGIWGLRNAAGKTFGTFWVQIVVGGTSATFAVTHVTYTFSSWSDAGHTNCPRVTANITANGAGTITYHWIRTDGPNATETLDFPSATTKSVNADWALGSAHNGETNFMGIYVDSPNHQDFGHQTFTTACTTP